MSISIPITNQRGAAAIEHVFSMGTLVGLVAALLFLGSVGVSKIWLRYAGNEAAICLASDSTQTQCEQDFRDRTQILERIGHMRNFQLDITQSAATVQWHFEINGFNKVSLNLDGEINLKLPLQAAKKGLV